MWAQIMNTIIGLWIMASPYLLDFQSTTATDNNHIIGPLIVTFAITSYWEVTRTVGKWNIPLGAWLLLAPWVLSFESTAAIANDMVCGALVIGFALVKSNIEQSFGGGWAALFHKDPEHEKHVR